MTLDLCSIYEKALDTKQMNDFESKINELNTKIEALKNEARKVVSEEWSKELCKIMSKSKLMKEIRVPCYVPYFNDGDECVFGVYEPYVNGEHWEDVNFLQAEKWVGQGNGSVGWNSSYEPNLDYNETEFELFDQIRNSVNSVDYLLQDIYGSHFELVITSDSVSSEEYTDHD